MRIVALANQKGGVGKTTTAVNLGAALAELGHRILLIDLDPQANATSSFGLQGTDGISLYDPLLGGASITEKILPTRRDGLFIVPADIDLAGAEVEIARMPNHLTRLAETLKPLQSDDTFDFVLLDCPPSLGILMSNALAAADELLTPIQCEHFAERVYQTVIPRSVRLSEAPSFGKSILEYAPNGAAASAYRALAREFIRRHFSSTTARESRRTLESENL